MIISRWRTLWLINSCLSSLLVRESMYHGIEYTGYLVYMLERQKGNQMKVHASLNTRRPYASECSIHGVSICIHLHDNSRSAFTSRGTVVIMSQSKLHAICFKRYITSYYCNWSESDVATFSSDCLQNVYFITILSQIFYLCFTIILKYLKYFSNSPFKRLY